MGVRCFIRRDVNCSLKFNSVLVDYQVIINEHPLGKSLLLGASGKRQVAIYYVDHPYRAWSLIKESH